MTFKELQATFDTYRLYKDRGVVRMVALSVIANQLITKGKKPLWVVFIAPPSGGKSDVVGSIGDIQKDGKDLCVKVSDLTSTALASGSKEQGASILDKVNPYGGILVFKDFTTMLSKRKEDLAMSMALLREIYDEEFDRAWGNGKTMKFRGKIGIIACCTTIIYHVLGELSVMGDRLMFYQIEQADQREVQKKIFENEDAGIDGSIEMADAMKTYTEGVMQFIEMNKDIVSNLKIENDIRSELSDISIFACAARSGVVWNYKRDVINFIPDREAPYRMLRQFIAMATGLMVMNMTETGEARLTNNDKKLIYKVAFDSIPSTRRTVINIVCKYARGATEQGIADKMGMQMEAVRVWIEELYSIGVFDKRVDVMSKKYMYTLKEEYVDIVKKYEAIETVEESLESKESIEESFNL